MRLDDARRLTGPNLYGPRPMVLLEVFLDAGETAEGVRVVVQGKLDSLRAEYGLTRVELRIVRQQPGWVALAHDSPIEEMLISAELIELTVLESAPHPSPLPASAGSSVLAEEARRRGVPFLWDDSLVSLGHSKKSVSFSPDAVPAPSSVDWDSLGSIPVAMVTGTNGKTTSTRLLARMVQEAGFVVGMTSSDSVTIAGKTLHEGDWTGPQAARDVLRNPEVQVAVLETARGGILRRGLACESIDVALITNISDDHLGGYGINSLEDMAQVKAVIARVAKSVVLNGRDPLLRGLKIQAPVFWFADVDGGADVPVGSCVVAVGGVIRVGLPLSPTLSPAWGEGELCKVSSVPITFGGAARYNVENALGATAAALALGIPRDAIVRALQGFTAADNPGRGETWSHDGVTLFVDFAHNPDGVGHALQVATSMLSAEGRLTVITGCAGDRTDAELLAICDRVRASKPVTVYVRELEHYLRGRQPDEVPAFFVQQLGATRAASEVDALTRATATARAGDVIALLVHVDRDEVAAFLRARGWQRR